MFCRLAAAVVAFLLASSIAANSEILVGASGALTGPMAWTGEQIARGADMAISDLNRGGGLLGQQLRLITADDFCDPKQALAAATKLKIDGVVAVIGHGCSGASLQAATIYDAAGIIQISPASTSPLLTEQGHTNVFRVIGRDDAQGLLAGNYLADHCSGKSIAVLNDGTTYGKGLADETQKQLLKRGLNAQVVQSYTPGKDDYTPEITALQSAGVEVVYVGGYYTDIALMARIARDRGYTVQVIAGDSMATEEYSLIAGPAAEGTLFTFPIDPRRNPQAAAVVKEFREANFEPDSYTLLSYAAVQAWSQAVKRVGSLDTKAVIASLHKNTFETVIGPISFDAKGDLTVQNWIWYVWRNGQYEPVEINQ